MGTFPWSTCANLQAGASPLPRPLVGSCHSVSDFIGFPAQRERKNAAPNGCAASAAPGSAEARARLVHPNRIDYVLRHPKCVQVAQYNATTALPTLASQAATLSLDGVSSDPATLLLVRERFGRKKGTKRRVVATGAHLTTG